MKSPSFVVAAVFASLVFVYDLWLVGAGLFHPGALLGVLGWMALLMAACARSERTPPHSGRSAPDAG